MGSLKAIDRNGNSLALASNPAPDQSDRPVTPNREGFMSWQPMCCSARTHPGDVHGAAPGSAKSHEPAEGRNAADYASTTVPKRPGPPALHLNTCDLRRCPNWHLTSQIAPKDPSLSQIAAIPH